jgi:hypothetical protein
MLTVNHLKTDKPKMNAVDNDCPRFRPFTSSTHRIKVKKANYTTSLDARGHIPGTNSKISRYYSAFFVFIRLQYMNILLMDSQ